MFIFTGVALVMEMAGFRTTAFDGIFNLLGITFSNSSITNFADTSSFWNTLFGTTGILVLLGASGAIGIGTFIYTKDKAYLMLPFITGTLFLWLSILVSISQIGSTFGGVFGAIGYLIMIPLSVGYIQSMVDYFMGLL